jgi:hypothetical protein
MSHHLWAILGVCLLGFMHAHKLAHSRARGQDTREVSGSFPAAVMACAAFEALALVNGAFTRETGLRRRPVMVT